MNQRILIQSYSYSSKLQTCLKGLWTGFYFLEFKPQWGFNEEKLKEKQKKKNSEKTEKGGSLIQERQMCTGFIYSLNKWMNERIIKKNLNNKKEENF